MHLRPSRNFSICFPIAACKQALVSPYRGVTQAGKERMFNLLSSPCPPPSPSSPFPTLKPVSSIGLHLVSGCAAALVWVSTSLFIVSRLRGFYVCTCKSFANMKPSKRTSWICSAWGVMPIPCMNRQICSMAKWPPVCQWIHPTHWAWGVW